MVIEVLEEKKRQKFLAVVFIIVLCLIFLVLFLGIFKKRRIFVPQVAILPEQKKIEINFDVLKDPALKELTPFEEVSLPKEKGRENPFLPYLPKSE